MALTKPILYTSSSFDASELHVFNFNVLGGSQVVKNQLFIIQGETIIYNNTQTTFSFSHILPANVLTNGEEYTAYVVTYDAQNNSSLPSNPISFTCYTTPVFYLEDIEANTSNIEFVVNYSQLESETLSSYSFNLYDANFRQIATSGVISTGNPVIPSGESLSYSYNFSGFINNTEYYIEVLGQTSGGTQITTGKEYFIVVYTNPSLYQLLTLTNNCNAGNITIQSNATAIVGKTVPDPPIYIDNNTAIDLSGENSYVLWDEGFDISNNWTIGVWGRHFNLNENIFEAKGTSLTPNIEVKLLATENVGEYVAKLYVYSPMFVYGYSIFSNSITISDIDNNINIWIRKINNLYEIKLAEMS